ncbi:EH signature domain-containing protein [Plesiomonas shigelloides]|uniref:EH signature domain-containing protein n=1 Tax=Plesiomonas shigelloides TaxID=703 RepID=UPI001C49BDB0|nr:EH signature domain-containing protein [Plesiomonas shigelloides]
MKLPHIQLSKFEWPVHKLKDWQELKSKAMQVEDSAGKNDAFTEMLSILREMARQGNFARLPQLLTRRVTARALTWLWLSDDEIWKRLLTPELLHMLVKAQNGRLTRLTLQQLVQFYFRTFDLLDQKNGVRESLEQCLLTQLETLKKVKVESVRPDLLQSLKNNGQEILSLDGPHKLVAQTIKQGKELEDSFALMGLQGFTDGRYGDVCRAHYYLESLKKVPLHSWSPVMDELLKPAVSMAPYQGNRCIGHAALEIIIDRSINELSESWQNFILSLAGDPRIANTAANYRQWWQPLGEARIQKVRGWLSKEDLRLFLQAVDQFGAQSGNSELQRMFPARKLFLEGLFKLKLIRNTRLMLGASAQRSVRNILGKEVKSNFVSLNGAGLTDKAVIYLDCGDFHLIEGSHSFKLWVYLASPSPILTNYARNSFDHELLTKKVPRDYQECNPNLSYVGITHSPNIWQSKVFSFLADNGIGLDIEQLLSPTDYRYQLQRFGLPVVRSRQKNTSITKHQQKQKVAPFSGQVNATHKRNDGVYETLQLEVEKKIKKLSPQAHIVLKYFINNPGDKARYAANVLKLDTMRVNTLLNGELKDVCQRNKDHGWYVEPGILELLLSLEHEWR